MNTVCNLISISDGMPVLIKADIETLFSIDKALIVGIDGSTTNTGISLIDYNTGNILGSISLARDKDESTVRYKVNFKKFLFEFMKNLNVKVIVYEQPFIDTSYTNADTIKALYMLRTSFEEVKIENEPMFDTIEYIETPNTKWKSILLSGKVPKGRDNQKKAVKEFIVSRLPLLEPLSEDEFDSIGIGFASYISLKSSSLGDMQAKKNNKPFKYHIEFIGADCDEDFIEEFIYCKDSYKIPSTVLENDNLRITTIGSRGIFNNYVYDEMGDSDNVIILKFSSKHHSNVVLEHRIANVAKRKYIYAVIWRKSRHISRR